MKALTSIMAMLFCLAVAIPAFTYTSIEYASSGICSLNWSANLVEKNFDGTLNFLAHYVFAAGKENNETYTFHEMLKQDNCNDFVDAIQVEVNAHQTREHWEIIPCSQMPKGMKTIIEIWSFKLKHLPNELLNKHKAQL